MKQLNMNSTVYEATQRYPELIGIISGWGYPQIRNNYLRRIIGSKFTINEAIKELGLSRNQICDSLRRSGFELVD